jgi:hypothetical protein
LNDYLSVMKKAAFLFCFLAGATIMRAQKEVKFILGLDGTELSTKLSLPFSALKIIDARLDQVNIGCVANDPSFKGITEEKRLAVFPENAKTYLPKILSAVIDFDNENKDTLVMLLKQLRITDHLSNSLDHYHEAETVLTLSCSFYKTDNSRLTKFFSVDDVTAEKWLTDAKPTKETMPRLRAAAVLRLLFTVFNNRNWMPASASFPLPEVEAAVRRRLQMPVFSNQALVPGLYKNFEEFKNNSPSVQEIRIGRQNNVVKEVQDLNANVIDTKSFWGLCDGESRYVCFQQGIHRLYPVDNSFRFVFYRRDGEAGFKPDPDNFLDPSPTNLIRPIQLNKTFSKYTRDEFLYLNMETGKVHTEEIIGTAVAGKFNAKSNQ